MLLARPLPRRALLRHAGRRLGRALAALLLDLRPPRGLRPDHSRLRLRVRDHPGLLAQGDLRLSGHGRGRRWRIGFVSLGVWAHHMFTVGHDVRRATPSSRSPRWLVGVPTGIKIFNWLGTHVGRQDPLRDADALLPRLPLPVPDRRPHRDHAGGRCRSTGSSATPTSWSRTSTTCWSARSLFTIFGAIYYWFPKATGQDALDERSGKWHFWLFVIGFHLTFDTMHIPGLLGHAAAHLHL